jgi:hypothetical protein
MVLHLRRLLAGAFALMAMIAFSSPAVASAGHAASQSATRHHAGNHHRHHRHHTSIPQHNAGDQDADNNGGPSDGDGTI